MSAIVTPIVLPDHEQRKKANQKGFENLHAVMRDSHRELTLLRMRLALTYWVVVILSVVMFVLGIVLLSVPAILVMQGRTADLQAFVAAGFGLADLTALFLFRPIERIHRLMGDMSQITLALTSFQTQVELRLIQMDASNRASVGQAAEAVAQIAPATIKLIEDYFETNPK
ncbi:MAG TPA: hypothetical protein VMP08_10455 [Anaerolineae bacterium]|nr:hypothetical protein [Anaerolineae bacterium]